MAAKIKLPVHTLLEVEREVTVTVHLQLTEPVGILVIVKLLVALELLTEVEKKLTLVVWLTALTSIFTPLEGIVDVTVTVNGKPEPNA